MPRPCCITLCKSRSGDAGITFHRLPGLRKNQGDEDLRLSQDRRELWVKLINRKNSPTDNWRICSKHFQSGKFEFCK